MAIDDVERIVGKCQGVCGALQKYGIRDIQPVRPLSGQLEHLVGYVDAHASTRIHALGQLDGDGAGATSNVEDLRSWLEVWNQETGTVLDCAGGVVVDHRFLMSVGVSVHGSLNGHNGSRWWQAKGKCRMDDGVASSR